jgi:hypothetical protein
MFQAPLFHLVSSPLYVLLREWLSPTEAALGLRVIPLLCGALQVECCHRVVRQLHPGREDLQALGTALGGLLPISVYLSQNLSNEPLLGLLGSGVILVSLGLLRDPARFRPRSFLLLGVLLGLAGLTKASALLLLPALVCLVGHAAWLHFPSPREALRRAASALALILAVALPLCGWYYARNWWVLGAPVVGGWDPSRGYVWWQEPGYRTLGQFLTFGAALSYPVYSAVHGFWDGFYSTLWLDGYVGSTVEFGLWPLWNFDYLLASAWLSLLPTAALALGVAAILARPLHSARSGELFALLWLATMVLAMLLLALRFLLQHDQGLLHAGGPHLLCADRDAGLRGADPRAAVARAGLRRDGLLVAGRRAGLLRGLRRRSEALQGKSGPGASMLLRSISVLWRRLRYQVPPSRTHSSLHAQRRRSRWLLCLSTKRAVAVFPCCAYSMRGPSIS